MSHIYRARIRVKNVIPQLMAKAVRIVAERFGLSRTQERVIRDYYGNRTEVSEDCVVFEYDLVGKAKNIAINLKTGEILGDFYCNYDLQEKLVNALEGVYVALSFERAAGSQYPVMQRRIDIGKSGKVELTLEMEV
ncbi:MAG: hypothetical protein Q6363_008045 [Candidatus Njordarchaeota archaeon]